VDFQVWVADTGKPLPLEYVVTDTGAPGHPNTISVVSNWNLAPKLTDAVFIFVPPPPAATGKPLPLGTEVQALPSGCTSTPVGGVEYYYCGGNFFRAVFQGNNLVYVTSQPK
jgi:hypothetical protein